MCGGPNPHQGYGRGIDKHFLHWAEDGSLLVFGIGTKIWGLDLIDSEVWTIADADPDAEGPSQMVNQYGYHADVSPDGSRLVYSTCEYPMEPTDRSAEGDTRVVLEGDYRVALGYEIVTMNVDGTARRRLTSNETFENYPVWSPDGTRIAFVKTDSRVSPRNKGDYNWDESQIFVMSADGTDIEVVPNTEGVGLYPPVWSPDGTRLAFTVNDSVEGRRVRLLYTVRRDGLELHRIGEASTLPTWSPDGERLAFGFNTGVYTARFDGADLRHILDGEVSRVSWSPDGSELLLAADKVFTVRPDGSGLRVFAPLEAVWPDRIDRQFRWLHNAVWSPDRSMIAAWQARDNRVDERGYTKRMIPILIVTTRDGSGVRSWVDETLGGRRYGFRPREFSPWTPVDPAACSGGIVVPEPETNVGLVEDCEALAALMVGLVGHRQLGWSEGVPIRDWRGVVVEGDPLRVRELLLNGRAHYGVIPPELGKLAMLKRLDLSSNKLNGQIPPELGKLTLLEVLNLSNTGLSGAIPPELGNLRMLRDLDISNNELSGCLPIKLLDPQVELAALWFQAGGDELFFCETEGEDGS